MAKMAIVNTRVNIAFYYQGTHRLAASRLRDEKNGANQEAAVAGHSPWLMTVAPSVEATQLLE